MRAKFKVLSGERLCEKALGVNLGEFGGSKSAFVSDKSYKSTLASEFKGSKNALASKFDGSKGVFVGDESRKNEFKNSKSTLASEFNGLKNALTSKLKNLKSVFASDESYKSTLTNEVKSLKNALTSKIKNSQNAFVGEFDSYENAVASQKGALMSAFKTHLSELKRAFASLCERTEFKNERVKKKLWRRNFSLSLSLSLSR